jgi:hypothetical protein
MMGENEQIRATFVTGIANITGSTRVANLVNAKIILLKRYIWLFGIALWSVILYLLFW